MQLTSPSRPKKELFFTAGIELSTNISGGFKANRKKNFHAMMFKKRSVPNVHWPINAT
jgi:hypothetical protein